MIIHTDKLTAADITRATRGDVYADLRPRGSRSRGRGFDVTLYYCGEKVVGDRRKLKAEVPSFTAPDGTISRLSATYDEHGEWMERLFTIDPNAIIGPYNGRDDFHEQTLYKYMIDYTKETGQ